MTENTLELRRDGSVLHIGFNRPERRNAITFEMMRALTSAFDDAAKDTSLRAIVLRGKGGHFCAGGDLNHMREPPNESGPDPVARAYRRMGEALMALNALPQAVIAAVEGSCVGGGLGMACSADFVIAAEGAKFGMPEVRAGFIPSQILPSVVRRIGEGQARRLAVMAEIIGADEALRIGIAHKCVMDNEAMDAAIADALDWLRYAEPAAVAQSKRLISSLASGPSEAVLDDAAATISRLLQSDAAAEGIAAFKEKRPPAWAKQ
jgi:isohexenylglutaconyl-CoA hydratase